MHRSYGNGPFARTHLLVEPGGLETGRCCCSDCPFDLGFGSHEHAELLGCEPVFQETAGPLSYSVDLGGLVVEHADRRRRSVEEGDRAGTVLGVGVCVSLLRIEQLVCALPDLV